MPSPLTVVSGTTDGSIAVVQVGTWAGARAATTGTLRATDQSQSPSVGNFTEYGFGFTIRRLFLPFGTTIDGSPTITAATLTLTRTQLLLLPSASYLCKSTQASTTLVAADFNNVEDVKFSGAIDFSANNSPTTFDLNAAGLAAINTAGNTFFALRHVNDIENTAPSPESSEYGQSIALANNTTAAYRPLLTVTYTDGSAATVPVWLLQHRSIGIGLGGPHA